jgi:integrase
VDSVRKTPAGRRTLEVPEVLRPLLVRAAANKLADEYLFATEDGKLHWRDWIINNVRRVCGLVKVPKVTAHAMRGLLATLTAERGLAGHLIAATLGHEDERTTMAAYAASGSAAVE